MVVFLIKHSKCLKLNISLSFFLPSTPGFMKISPNSFKLMPEISITTEPEKQGWNWNFYWGMMTRIKIPYMHSWFPLPSDFSKSRVSQLRHILLQPLDFLDYYSWILHVIASFGRPSCVRAQDQESTFLDAFSSLLLSLEGTPAARVAVLSSESKGWVPILW